MLVAALPAVLLLAGCGLPLRDGVQVPDSVPVDDSRAADVVVLPAGPPDGATARQLVEGYLVAQRSTQDDHRVARQYLLPDAEWDDEAGARVYDPTRLVYETAADGRSVRVTFRQVARVAPDGSYSTTDRTFPETFRVEPDERGRQRLAAVPPGLLLSPAGLRDAFTARQVHFLAPPVTGGPGHLVADQVWLQDDTAVLTRLVAALLAGPSAGLRGSVTTALPEGTQLRSASTGPDGTVTVDLSGEVATLTPLEREQLSAQLVWTLRSLRSSFVRLRLLVDGQPLQVAGTSDVQSAGDWPQFDPDRLLPDPVVSYIADRQLRTLSGGLADSPVSRGERPVDAAAASPEGRLALLTRTGRVQELAVGPQGGPFPVRLRAAGLTSPTWGSGERGLWLVQRGEARGQVLLVPPTGEPRPVDLDFLPAGADVRAVRVARDGVRVALVVGERGTTRLYVGRLDAPDRGDPRVVGLREVVPTLTDVRDVAWESGTSLVVVARFPPLDLLPGRLAVDGSESLPLPTRLPTGVDPVSVTAVDGEPVVLAGRPRPTAAGAPEPPEQVFVEQERAFAQQAEGRAPFYPG